MTLNRVRVAITGATGLPGVCTFHFGSTTTDMTALRTFWDATKTNFPNTVTISVPSSGDQINDDSGQISGAWNGPAQTNVIGTGGVGGYLSTAGLMVRWVTPQVVNGRRPIGKTFLVPAVTSQFSPSGTVTGASLTAITAAAQALVVAYAGEMKTYHRPTGNPPHGGVACTIISGGVINKQVVLRSRRD